MKVVKLPTEDGPFWWIVVHELTLAEGRLRKLRPIHVFTLLAQTIIKTKRERKRMFHYCLALENKLFGVRFHQLELRKTLGGVGDLIYHGEYVRDYDDEQKVICALEAYLNAIYTALELASQINHLLYPSFPIGFRGQSKKFEPFSFSKWNWLPHFYDIRAELVHFGTLLPIISGGKLLIEFTTEKQLEMFNKGRHEIPFTDILHYSINLFRLLDTWAKKELSKVNQDQMIESVSEMGLHSPLKIGKVKAKEILDLLK